MTACQSDASLAETLGLKRGMRVWFHNMPDELRDRIDPDRIAVEEQPCASDGLQGVHLFVTEHSNLERELPAVRPLLATHGFVWVAWQAPQDGRPSGVSDRSIHAVAAPLGLVESKRCALDPRWSAMKLVAAHDLHD